MRDLKLPDAESTALGRVGKRSVDGAPLLSIHRPLTVPSILVMLVSAQELVRRVSPRQAIRLDREIAFWTVWGAHRLAFAF